MYIITENAPIMTKNGEVVGKITSGAPSPTLKKNIAMGYVKSGFHKQNTELTVSVRNKTYEAKIVKMPFVSHNYHRS